MAKRITIHTPRSSRGFQRQFGRLMSEFGLLVMLVVLMAVFSALNPYFFTFGNFKNLLEQNSVLAIVAVGMTFAIISRNIDLSPGSVVALAGVALGLVFASTGNFVLGALAAIATAIVVNLFNGFLIAKLRINSLIVTLAAWIWARGLGISLTGADSIVIRHPVVDFFNGAQFLGISPPLVMIALAYAFGWFVLNRTRLGRYTYAIGGDERATTAAGVDVDLYKLLMFGMMGLFVGFASLIAVSRLGAAAPDAAYNLELDAIVAVIIGGNPFQGAEGSLRKTFIGVLFIAMLNNGLNNLGMRDSYFYLYKGLTIVIALFFDVLSHRMLKGAEPIATAQQPAEA